MSQERSTAGRLTGLESLRGIAALLLVLFRQQNESPSPQPQLTAHV